MTRYPSLIDPERVPGKLSVPNIVIDEIMGILGPDSFMVFYDLMHWSLGEGRLTCTRTVEQLEDSTGLDTDAISAARADLARLRVATADGDAWTLCEPDGWDWPQIKRRQVEKREWLRTQDQGE